MAAFSDMERRVSSSVGPDMAASEEKSIMRPCTAPTNFVPNRSDSYAGRIAYTPPIMEMARAVEAQKPYRGIEEPVVTTFSTSEGRKK